MQPESVKKAVLRGDFNPTDLLDLAHWITEHRRNW